MGWLFWKFYPIIKQQGGLKGLLNPTPVTSIEPKNKQNIET